MHPVSGPVSPDGLEDPRFASVGHDEGVVVEQFVGVARLAVLPVFGQQARDDIDGFLGGARPLEPEAQQVHAEQTGGALALGFGEDRLVADGYAVFVDAHLRAPDPVRLGQDHRVRVRDLVDLDVGGSNLGRLMIGGRHREQLVGFVGFPVTILAEDHRPVPRGVGQADERVAHVPIVRLLGHTSVGVAYFSTLTPVRGPHPLELRTDVGQTHNRWTTTRVPTLTPVNKSNGCTQLSRLGDACARPLRLSRRPRGPGSVGTADSFQRYAASHPGSAEPGAHVEWVPLLIRSGSVTRAIGPSATRDASNTRACERSSTMSMVNVTR